MQGPIGRRRTLMAMRDIWTAPKTRSHPMDVVYIAVGAAMFALFGLYAVLLRRI